MGDALVGLARADIDQPFAQHRLVDEGAPPEGARDTGMAGRDQVDGRARDIDDLTLRDRTDAVVHLIEDEHVEVAEVARYEIGHDLALAIRQNLVAAGESVEDQVDVLGIVALVDQVDPRTHLPDPRHEVVEGRSILVGQRLETLKLPNERMVH